MQIIKTKNCNVVVTRDIIFNKNKSGKLILNPLQKVFLDTQQNILQLISNKNKLGIATYKERQLFEALQEINEDMYNKCNNIAPSFFERIFRQSKINKAMRRLSLSHEETNLLQRITDNFMSNILQTGDNLIDYLKRIVVQTKKEVYKTEYNISRQDDLFKQLYRGEIQKRGLVAFTDKSNKNWTIGNYTDMLLRTTTRMTHNYGILYTYENIDLYMISKHGSTCKLCAPLEGRVYSRSGTHPIYPPLAMAFGKINKNGGNDLSNTYLSIHPNCLHTLIPFTEHNKSNNEVDRIRQFSSFETNPPTRDPRSEKQIEAYHKKEDGRNKLNEAFKEFQMLKMKKGNVIPKSFQTFLNHKLSNSNKYKTWIS